MVEWQVNGTFGLASIGVAEARNALESGMKGAVQMVVAQAKRNASGRPGPNVDTGRLRSSITGEVRRSGAELVGVVGTNVQYAPVLEFGFSGSVTVKAHSRNITQVFGHSIAPLSVSVSSHSRKMNRKALPFLTPAVQSPFMRAVIRAKILEGVAKYWGKR